MAKTKTRNYTVRPGRTVKKGLTDGTVETYGPGEDVELDIEAGDMLIQKGFVHFADSEEAQAVKEIADQIPANFPAARELDEGGIVTFKALTHETVESLTKIEGIGEATAAEIIEARDARKG